MSLQTEINNTNTQKENIKTVANNIDNKLVELGGEQAIDLSDVPNKMQRTINKNYKKLAKKDINMTFARTESDDSKVEIVVPLNLEFEPEILFMSFSIPYEVCLLQGFIEMRQGLQFEVQPKNYPNWGPSLYVHEMNKNRIVFKLQSGGGWDSRIQIKVEKIMAIG